jgi:hypothetical protein
MVYVVDVALPSTQGYRPCLLIESYLSPLQLTARLAGLVAVYYRGLLDATATIDRFSRVDGVTKVTIVEQLALTGEPSESIHNQDYTTATPPSGLTTTT